MISDPTSFRRSRSGRAKTGLRLSSRRECVRDSAIYEGCESEVIRCASGDASQGFFGAVGESCGKSITTCNGSSPAGTRCDAIGRSRRATAAIRRTRATGAAVPTVAVRSDNADAAGLLAATGKCCVPLGGGWEGCSTCYHDQVQRGAGGGGVTDGGGVALGRMVVRPVRPGERVCVSGCGCLLGDGGVACLDGSPWVRGLRRWWNCRWSIRLMIRRRRSGPKE